jgi:hypothetical protein
MIHYQIIIILTPMSWETENWGLPKPDLEYQLHQAEEISYNLRRATVEVCHINPSHGAQVTDARFKMGKRLK